MSAGGERLQDFFRCHNLDETRRKLLESIKEKVNKVNGGPFNSLANYTRLDL
ncbi:MAG: hypothetical protein WB988_15185 [Candidatus Nitrosopolaris sp.]